MWLILLWPVMVFLGWLVAGTPKVAVFLLGPINLLVAGIPVLWFYNAAQRKLDTESQIRKWRIFGFSFAITPIVVIGVEIVALLIMSVAAGVWVAYRISVDPSFERELMFIINQISIAGNDLDKILQLLEPYLMKPAVLVWAVVIVGGVIPVIEETIKPLALWSLVGRKITPQEGFVNGLLCGAGFALMENLLYATTAVMADDWLIMVVGRAGTGLLHMLASGIVGWGLAMLWRDGKWIFSGLTILGAFLLHGVWNAVALISGVAPLLVYGPDATITQTLLYYLPVFSLLIISVLGLFLIRRHLLRKQSSEIIDINDNQQTSTGALDE
jgi:RsiW-degrading membrane proteinase PrsW (M82 family)